MNDFLLFLCQKLETINFKNFKDFVIIESLLLADTLYLLKTEGRWR